MNRKYIQNISSGFRWRLLFTLMTVFSCQSYSYGQSGNSGNPIDMQALFNAQQIGTPTTAALKQNIVYPVNYSTGLPEIKIPLYEVRSGEVVLPIYLTYHASGIKLSDAAGWAGLGWNLVAEPMISRTVRGWIDDPLTMTCEFNKNDYISRFPDYVKNLTSISNEEPDEYYYRLSDKQGMFMYAMEPVDKSRKFLPLPYENIRIDWLGKYFQIADDDGTVYKFGGGREMAVNNIIGWKASSIVASNKKDSISFVYDDRQVQYRVKIHDDYIVVKDNYTDKIGIETDRRNRSDIMDYAPDEFMQDPIVVSKVNGVTYGLQRNAEGELISDGTVEEHSAEHYSDMLSQPLSEIHFSQGKLVFAKEPGFPRIQKITVYNCDGTFVKEIRFKYLTPNDRIIQRYFLEELVMTDADGEPLEIYHFDYDYPNNLMPPGNRSIDYWGYYNGINRPDNETLVPCQTIDTSRWKYINTGTSAEDIVRASGGNILTFGSTYTREVDEDYMRYGTLTGITYPAGSTDEFVYEAHRYKDEKGMIKQAGGLRIKEIKTRNKGEKVNIRTFIYGQSEDGCGTPLTTNVLDYMRVEQGIYLCDIRYISSLEYFTGRQRTFFSNPTRPITFDGGSSVMYNYVTEYNGTPENNAGKTVYEYAIDRTHPMPEDQNTMQCNRHLGWQFGHLTDKAIYKNEFGKYIPLEKTSFHYSSADKYFGKILVGEAFANNVIRASDLSVIPHSAKSGYSYRRTEISVGCKLLLSTSHKVYTGETSVVTSTRYEYADPATTYPTRITETGPDGIKYVTSLTYPQDYGDIYPYSEMVERNILSPVVKKEYTRGREYLGIETPYFAPFANVYEPESAIIRRSASENGDTRVTYSYDDYGKVRQETKDGKRNVVYLYGYSNQHVIALIENVTYEEVIAKLGGEDAVKRNASAKSPFMYNIDKLRQSLPSARVTTYTYKPLVGIVSITNPLGLTTCYEYDDLNRLIKTYIVNGNRQEVIEKNEYHYANQ
ncbi:hypothetical protein [Bacteroides sp. GM023]|uniref:hypothetical protein n=1 Tax=Bacteroides sp. GM023 TaxID=2723058 RepID=UPI00168ADE7F|nr:hypothetical protein [Bacteroides sp. GM023]MBD3588342.1 hypothetical protein [Bacteroides sp. GM023]